jgi:hypothetical protein
MAVADGLRARDQFVVQRRLGAVAGIADAGVAVDDEKPVRVLFEDIFEGDDVAAVEAIVDVVLDRPEADLLVQPADAAVGPIGADLAGIGHQDQRGAGIGGARLQRLDLAVEGGDQLGRLFLAVEDFAQCRDIRLQAFSERLAVDRKIDGRGDFGNLAELGARAAADDHQIGLRRVDGLIVRLEQRPDLGVVAGRVFRQIGRQVRSGHARRLDAKGVDDVERVDVEHQHLFRGLLKRHLALRVLYRQRLRRHGRKRQHAQKYTSESESLDRVTHSSLLLWPMLRGKS